MSITRATLKTVQEVLCELDTEKLIGTYCWHFPIGYEEHPELLDMTVREIQERVRQRATVADDVLRCAAALRIRLLPRGKHVRARPKERVDYP